MSVISSGGTKELTRQQGIPTGVTGMLSWSMGAWFYFTAWPVSRQMLYEYGPENDRMRVEVNSSGQLILVLENNDQGSPSAALELDNWHFIVYTRVTVSGVTTHKLKLSSHVPDAVYPFPSTTSPETLVTSSVAASSGNAIKLYITNYYRVCNFNIMSGSAGENQLMNNRVSWLGQGGTKFWHCLLRTPLDITSLATGLSNVSGAGYSYTDKYFWDDETSATLVLASDPPHLIGTRASANYFQDTEGAQYGHAPLPIGSSVVSSAGLIGYELIDDGRIPLNASDIFLSWRCHASSIPEALGRSPMLQGYATIPLGGDAYPTQPQAASVVGQSDLRSYGLGALSQYDGSTFEQGIDPSDGLPITRDDLFDCELNMLIWWGPNPFSDTESPCKTLVLSSVDAVVSYIGNFDSEDPPPTPPTDVYDPNTSPCRDDGNAWWFDNFDGLDSLSPYYITDDVTLSPTGGVDDSKGATGNGSLTKLISPNTKSFSISFRHKF